MPTTPVILISRRARQIGVDWSNACSFFGGAPRLGGVEWPRDQAGKPLHFVAQIDFAEIAMAAGETPLPKEGSLAFFVGGTGAAVFIPAAQSAAPTLPPPDTPDLTNCGADSEWPYDLQGRALFPYWPIDFHYLAVEMPEGLDADDYREAVDAAQMAAIAAHFPRREYSLSADAVFEGPPIPDWWRCAIYVADKLAEAVKNAPKALQTEQNMLAYAHGRLKEARAQSTAMTHPQIDVGAAGGLSRLFGLGRAKPPEPNASTLRLAAEAIKKAENTVELYEKKIAKLHGLLPGLKEFAAEVADWTLGRDPWSLMDTDDRARLEAYWARQTEFPEYTVHYGVTPLDYLKTQMFATLPGEQNPAFAALPDDVRAVISGRRVPHPQWWRTVIQFTKDMQDALARRTPYTLNSKREKLAATGPPKASELVELDAKAASFRDLAAEMAEWTKGRNPLRPMSVAEISELSEKLARFEALREIASSYYVKRLADFERSTLITLATADDDAYATLPEDTRELINQRYLLPMGIPHQISGQAVFIQGDACAEAEEGKHLLLQLGYDDMMFWGFGDNGAYTFWISPEDLAQRNWDRVTMTFECH